MIKFVDSTGLSRFLYNCKNIFQALKYKVTSWTPTPSDTNYPSEKLVKDSLDLKQATLVSGSNIKTINTESILGSGNINVYYPGTYIGTGTGWGAGTTSGYLRSAYFQGPTPSKVGDLVYSTSTGCLHRITALHYDSGQSCYYADSVYYVTTFERTSRLVTSISSASTDAQYPSAKCVYDALQGTKPMSFVTLNQGSGDYLYFTGSGTALLSISDGENDSSVLFVYYGVGGDYTNVYIYAADSNYKDYDVDFIIDNDISKSYILLSGSSGVVTFGFMKLSGDIGYDVNGQPDMIDVETIPIIELERTSNKVTSLSASSTDTEYPSAKCVYDLVGNIETLLAAI